MPKKLYTRWSSVPLDLTSFKRQESVFVVLQLVLLVLLLVLHHQLPAFWGTPSSALLAIIGAGVALRTAQLVWVQRANAVPPARVLNALTWTSILLNLLLAVVLSELTDHEDSPYFVLMLLPILESAFRFSLPVVTGVVVAADFLNFFWVGRYFAEHPPLDKGEYLEAGIVSIIFTVVGFLFWILVNHLRQKELHLATNLLELGRTREQLLQETALAAVGRLSSAIAHEIRNPVAMISSSLATATRGGLEAQEREEMFDIAAREALRLEKLTDEFLSYARPRPPQKMRTSVSDTLAYVTSVCRAHAAEKRIRLQAQAVEDLYVEVDPEQVQQALLNLVMNAVDAAPEGSTVRLNASCNGGRQVQLEVENAGPAIAQEAAPHIFEPFFTTKRKGTGLGLAIARNIAHGHGGDLVVSSNRPACVRFSMILPTANGAH